MDQKLEQVFEGLVAWNALRAASKCGLAWRRPWRRARPGRTGCAGAEELDQPLEGLIDALDPELSLHLGGRRDGTIVRLGLRLRCALQAGAVRGRRAHGRPLGLPLQRLAIPSRL